MKRHNPVPQAWGSSPIEFIDQDYSNENFEGENFRDANLKGSNLSGSSFRNANLEGAILYGCDLSNCDFTGANLDKATLAFANVEEAVFKSCSMFGTTLFDPEDLTLVREFSPLNLKEIGGFVIHKEEGSILQDLRDSLSYTEEHIFQFLELAFALADLFEDIPEITKVYSPPIFISNNGDRLRPKFECPGPVCPVAYTSDMFNFAYLSLPEIDLSDTKMPSRNFRDAMLQAANMAESDFSESNFERANLFRADLSNAYLGESNLKGANLRRVEGQKTYFGESELEGADLRRADLTCAVFPGCRPQRIGFERQLVHGCDFDSCRCTRCKVKGD